MYYGSLLLPTVCGVTEVCPNVVVRAIAELHSPRERERCVPKSSYSYGLESFQH